MIEIKDQIERLYTPEEASQILRVNRRKIIKMGTEGEIEMVRISPRVFRFTARSLQKWLKPKRAR